MKQMKIIHGNGFSNTELEEYRVSTLDVSDLGLSSTVLLNLFLLAAHLNLITF